MWTPIGSKFSMLQTVMQLSAPSRITSYSTSFQPSRRALDEHLADRAGGEAAGDDALVSSSGVCATPPPVPPSV